MPTTLADLLKPMLRMAGITTLHPAFEEALHFNLAMVLLPRYGRQGFDPAVLAANAQNSKARIVELNRSINGGPAPAPEK